MVIQQGTNGLRELALFAGIGGGILGGKLLGWRTVCGVERNAYCAAVLAKRQDEGHLEPFPIWSDIETFDGTRWRGRVDVVSGGFPCQDISCAGKGAGIDGERSGLWGQMARIIGEVRPRFCLIENSPMLVTRGLDRVLGNLAEMGFDARWGVVSAADAIWSQGNPCIDHERERIWIVGTNADSARNEQGREKQRTKRKRTRASGESIPESADSRLQQGRNRSESSEKIRAPLGNSCKDGDSNEARWERSDNNGQIPERIQRMSCEPGDEPSSDDVERGFENERESFPIHAEHCGTERRGWWKSEPGVGRVATGIPYRVDRLAGLGNAQVPGVVQLAWKLLTGMES